MARGASIFQLVMYSLALLLAAVEVGICTRFVITFAAYDDDNNWSYIWMWSIGGIVHGAVLCLYFILFFSLHRRNNFMVRTTTDLVLGFILFASCIPVGVFCAAIAFAPAAPLLLNFIVEAIVVGKSNVPGKWSLSLFNVCEGKNNNTSNNMNYGMNQNVGTTYAPMPSGQSSFVDQPYSAVPNPGPAPAYNYPTQYPTQYQTPYQTPYGHQQQYP